MANTTMNKRGLAEALADRMDLSDREAWKTVGALLDILTEELVAGRSVRLIGIGRLETSQWHERTARNPRTNAVVTVPARKTARLRPSPVLLATLNGGEVPKAIPHE